MTNQLLNPVSFQPLFYQRVWGGRDINTIYGKQLPADGQPYGESWEIVDRSDAQSVVSSGVFAGKTLNQLWSENYKEVFGLQSKPAAERFPVLCKILDARDDLSLQVHPPAEIAPSLGGEPKNEMWYVTAAEQDAKLYAGMQRELDCAGIADALGNGTILEEVKCFPVAKHDSIYIPSGCLHAIGAGLVIFEIQQNSDTTYRVFDWNRMGLDGKPRELHIEESLASIEYQYNQVELNARDAELIADNADFSIKRLQMAPGQQLFSQPQQGFSLLAVVEGNLQCADGSLLKPGDFVLLPHNCSTLQAQQQVVALQVFCHVPA